MNLEQLKFDVDTTAVKTAVSDLTALATALNKVKTASNSAANTKVNAGADQAAKTAENVKAVSTAADRAQKKLDDLQRQVSLVEQGFTKTQASGLMQMEKVFGVGASQVKEMENAFKAMAPATKAVVTEVDNVRVAIEKVTKASVSMEERQKSITDFMTQGFSRGQSSILATAKAAGLAADEIGRIGEQLLVQRKLQGGNPFDNSAQGLLTLKNRYVELKEATRQYNADTNLTRAQTRDLARDKERLIIKMKTEGEGFQAIRQAIRLHNQEFLAAADSVNKLTVSEREMERQRRDVINSTRLLANENEKVDSIVRTLTGSTDQHTKTSERAAASIARYERLLRQSGIAGAEAAQKLEIYRKKIAQIQVTEEARKKELLSNALAPQISDVVVSLAGGQNPITVALQQGLQVRDLIGQSGVAAKELQATFATAASSMVQSLAQTGVAIGSLLIGSIKAAGSSVIDFGANVTGTNIILGKLQTKIAETGGAYQTLATVASGAAQTIAGAFSAFVLGSVVALTKGLYDVIKQENELARVLATSSGSMAISHARAIEYARAMNDVGVSTNTAMQVITAMAKEGRFLASEIQLVTKAAADLNTFGGVAIEDTVKKFAELKKSPVDALTDLAKSTGLVSVETLKLVSDLQIQGNTADATAIAMQEFGRVSAEQAKMMKGDYNGLSLFLIKLSKSIGDFFDETYRSIFRKDAPQEFVRKALATAQSVRRAAGAFGAGKEGGFLAEREAALREELKFLEQSERVKEQSRADASRDASQQERINKRRLEFMSREEKMAQELRDLTRDRARYSEEEYRNIASSIQQRFSNDSKSSGSGASRSTKSEAGELSYYNKVMREFTSSAIAAEVAQDDLTKAQVRMLQVIADPKWAELGRKEKETILNAFARNHAEEESLKTLTESMKLANSVREHSAKLQQESLVAGAKLNEELYKNNEALRTELETVGLSADELRAYNEAKAQSVIASKEALIVNLKNVEGNELLILQLEQEIALLREKGVLSNKIADAKFSDAIKRNIVDGLTGSIETALFEGGKAGGKKLRDFLEAEFRKPFRVIIEAIVSKLTGGISDSIKGAFSGGSSGSALSTGSSLSSIKSAYDMVSGSMNVASNAGLSIAKNLGNISALGSDTLTTMAGEFAGGMMSTASTSSFSSAMSGTGAQMAGAIVGSVMNGISGYGISKALSGGYSAGKGVNTIAGIASMIPGIGPIAGVIGGLVNRAFGRKAPVVTGSGITGNLNSSSGADVSQYVDKFSKGGWFRSDKRTREYSGVTGEFDNFLDSSVASIVSTTKTFAAVLGLVPEAVDNVNYAINVSLMNLNAEQQAAAIQSAFGGFSNVLSNILLVGSSFAKEGETSFTTLTRLATSLSAVNAVFDTLGSTLMQTSLRGADASSKLIDVFGGIEQFTQKTSAYYDAYFSEQEKLATTTRQLTAVFGTMGLTLPKTREEFKALVESQDLMTDAGRGTYAALINLAPVFATITTAVEEFTSGLIDEVRRLRGEVAQSSGAAGLDFLKSQFTIANAQAKAGDANALSQLPALSQAVEQAARTQANSSQDIIRIQAWLANALSETSGGLGASVPAFASGGTHMGGARIVGENGPELEVTGPSRIYSASQTSSMMNGNLENLVIQLNENITGLRAEVRADVAVNAKTAKLLDRVIPDGDALNITGSIDGGQV